MAEFKVGVSPLTNIIYAGPVLKNGMWGKGKKEITDMAVSAVAQHLLIADEKLVFEYRGEEYELSVKPTKNGL
jgi:hypothetical protein